MYKGSCFYLGCWKIRNLHRVPDTIYLRDDTRKWLWKNVGNKTWNGKMVHCVNELKLTVEAGIIWDVSIDDPNQNHRHEILFPDSLPQWPSTCPQRH